MKDSFELSYHILRSADEYRLKSEFFKNILTLLAKFFQCDAALLLLNDGKKYFLSRDPEFISNSYHFEVFPYPNEKKRIKLIGEFDEISGQKPRWPFAYWMKDGTLTIEHMDRFFSSNTQKIKKILTAVHPLDNNNLSLSCGLFDAGLNEKGFMLLAGRKPDHFSKPQMEQIEGIKKIIHMTLMNRRYHAALDERLKELSCLYNLVQLYDQPDKTVDEILQGTVELLPPAWQFPELASARIIFDNRIFTSRKFNEGRNCQKADLIVNGKRRGFVEVLYSEIRPLQNDGPFLLEERKLIENISRELSLIVERRLYEEEKAKLQDQLRHADRLAMIGQLAAAVTHELNEPLANILGFAQLTLKTEGLPEQTREDIQKILAASLHSREIIRKLLAFARPAPSKKSPLNLNKIITDSLYFFESRCSKEGIGLKLVLDPALPVIHANPNQLMQVVINLVVNAMQAMPHGGNLTVETSVLDDNVVLVVTDTGIGIADEIKEKIFTPFFSNKKRAQGTGLGLPIVHEIVLEHGGAIQVESETGQGARFKIQFPISKSPKIKRV